MSREAELELEAREAFDDAKLALMFDYMYMGTMTDNTHGYEYHSFKHIETRDYIKIPKRT
tara:strand:+ start:43 stop:222 length:180 start_codon:yes stop_codon:yes gene_type:complete